MCVCEGEGEGGSCDPTAPLILIRLYLYPSLPLLGEDDENVRLVNAYHTQGEKESITFYAACCACCTNVHVKGQ